MTPGTTPTTVVMTEARGRRWRSEIPVRTRITTLVALLTATAMATAGLIVYGLESERIEQAVEDQVDQEIAEFRELSTGVDPETGRPFTGVAPLLELFLTRNVPDDDEMLVAYVGEQPQDRTRNRYGEEVLADQEYQAAVADLADEGGTAAVDSDRFGEVWVTVVPVRNRDTRGALAIVSFLDDEHSELVRTMRTYAVVAMLSLGLIVLVAASQSGRLLAPLRTLRETANEITATDLSRRIPEKGHDDITALTRTTNDMLDRLEKAFTDQRRFLDDAGHELKTPLTVMRGHLELLDKDDPHDVEETRALLLDEVDRMSRLVVDLILLAKSRRPDFLRPGPVSLERVTHTMLAKARGLGERDWQLDGAAEAVVPLDEQRITQAVLQLAGNAVKHTGEDDVVALGSSYDEGTVRIWVRDTGDGVPEEDRVHIFERFGRSKVRPGDEGFGLGLSIVAAIVEAHGGTVHVEPAEPRGSRFVITLSEREAAWHAS